MGLSKVVFFSNANEVVDTINGLLQKYKIKNTINGQMDWASISLFLDIKIQCSCFSFVELFLICRTSNETAHILSKRCSQFNMSFCWNYVDISN